MIKSILLVMVSFMAVDAIAADLTVVDRPLVYRVLLQETPSRGIAVGYPNQFNYVLDSVSLTPLYVWTGGFLNLNSELKGRGGRACTIRGNRIPLKLIDSPLRFGNSGNIPELVVFKGYQRSGREAPSFQALIDDNPVRMTLRSTSRKQVTIFYELAADRKQNVFFLPTGFADKSIGLGPGVTWLADRSALTIPLDQQSFSITLDLSERKLVVLKKEKITGKLLYTQYCSACHSLNGQKMIGPSFKGLWGKKEKIAANGSVSQIQVDADYLKSSVIDPQRDIVEGYSQVPMPSFKELLSAEEVDLLISFIRQQK